MQRETPEGGVVSAATIETPAHETTRAQWKAFRGVHTPHIGEVSGVQLARMSGAARRRYDATRAAEWQASADAGAEYARACIEAYDADPTVLDRATQDAREAIHNEIARREAAARVERIKALSVENDDLASMREGDRVWWLVGGRFVRVVRVLRVSLRVALDGERSVGGMREILVSRRECRWLHYNDLVAAADAGRTIAEQRAVLALGAERAS